ncbi:Hypothetical Protein FCC1311_077102 [Hondaea fermentalgiana]|uniref:Inner membrane component domain-containing protein n=1 Tax=Hondaea fermentalgiana TaxID=2315210 RepID=A0A2R5GKP8_9STRA|nr:Hypothetical Protein FCC1311_077102 [Hondaea fermentalgiana]|eukprot:GBG31486.1 Hypothetical Protein FCC1311_077102 [Hondaea fermentalgiana]
MSLEEAIPVAAAAPMRVQHETRTVTYETREDQRTPVTWVGNFLWIWLAGGAVVAAIYAVLGLLLMATIVLSPFGWQLLKISKVALFPFGMSVEAEWNEYRCAGLGNVVGNILFLPIGLIMLAFHILAGILCACTCYGIVFSYQHFKLAQLALCPFGSHGVFERVSRHEETTHLRTDMYDNDNMYGDRQYDHYGNDHGAKKKAPGAAAYATAVRSGDANGYSGQYAKSTNAYP